MPIWYSIYTCSINPQNSADTQYRQYYQIPITCGYIVYILQYTRIPVYSSPLSSCYISPTYTTPTRHSPLATRHYSPLATRHTQSTTTHNNPQNNNPQNNNPQQPNPEEEQPNPGRKWVEVQFQGPRSKVHRWVQVDDVEVRR